MSIAHPLAFVLALLAGLALLWLYRRSERRAADAAYAYSHLPFLVSAIAPRTWIARAFAAAWMLAALFLALAFGGARVVARVPVHDGAVVVCVDTSGSMRSTDVAPTRSEAANAAVRAFLNGVASGTRVGIVAFSTAANVVAPLSDDLEAERAAVDRIPGPNGATAIGDALSLAGSLLPNHGRRAVVLVTDGVNNRGMDPEAAAKDLAARGIAVYAVGIGTNNGELIPGTTETATIDENALQAIATETGGKYVRVADASQLNDALAAIARSTVWEAKRVEAALPFALAGGVMMLLAFVGGTAVGKIP